MKPEQRIVAVGAASGVAAMVLAVWGLTVALPTPAVGDALAERLAYALRLNVVAVLPLFIMIITVANSRFLSEAIDPTRHAESVTMQIDGRVVDNTLQQNFVFALGSLAVSTIVPQRHLQLVLACVIVFVVARFLFWFGYRINPLYRAPGMSSTAYMNLGLILYVLYALVALGLAGCASTAASPEARADLAPGGKLRAAINLGNPALAKRDAKGEVSGITIDLGRALADRLGAEFVPVLYPNVGGLVDGAKSGAWDIGFAAIDPTRADTLEFTAPYMEVSVSLLVPAGSAIQALADADRAGMRIGVGTRNAADLFLTRSLKQAELVRTPDNLDAAVDLLRAGRADVYASNREGLLNLRDKLPGYRIVDNRFYAVEHAIALPRGRQAGLAFASAYVEELKRSGEIARAIERNALRGVDVAPPAK